MEDDPGRDRRGGPDHVGISAAQLSPQNITMLVRLPVGPALIEFSKGYGRLPIFEATRRMGPVRRDDSEYGRDLSGLYPRQPQARQAVHRSHEQPGPARAEEHGGRWSEFVKRRCLKLLVYVEPYAQSFSARCNSSGRNAYWENRTDRARESRLERPQWLDRGGRITCRPCETQEPITRGQRL